MNNFIRITKRIAPFKKKIKVPGDKSLSIRWVLFSSMANGISRAKNLLLSDDVLAAIDVVKKLGIRVVFNKRICKIYGKGMQ